jgi:nitronate monooxygenase
VKIDGRGISMKLRDRASEFCRRLGLEIPILLAPMAGACPPSLSIAVANAGGMGACGALMMAPDDILDWVKTVRAGTAGPFQLNLWIPDPPPTRDRQAEERVRSFISQWGAEVPANAGDGALPDFDAQCEALLKAQPTAISSVMGLFPAPFVNRMKRQGIPWFAVVSTVAEAEKAEATGADVIVAQGMEAGGHRAAFDAAGAEDRLVGLMSLVPAVVDAVRIPVVATGASLMAGVSRRLWHWEPAPCRSVRDFYVALKLRSRPPGRTPLVVLVRRTQWYAGV